MIDTVLKKDFLVDDLECSNDLVYLSAVPESQSPSGAMNLISWNCHRLENP